MYCHMPQLFAGHSPIDIERLARSERFLSQVKDLRHMGFRAVQTIKNRSQVDMAISCGIEVLKNCNSERIRRVFYCSFWNEESWTEFHCAKVHSALGLRHDAIVASLRMNSAIVLFAALDAAAAHLAISPKQDILILAADKIDLRFVRRKFAGGVFGDGAAAMLVSNRRHASPAIRLTAAPRFLVDGRFHRLDSYERNDIDLLSASRKAQAALIGELATDLCDAGPVTFLSQIGTRFDLADFAATLQLFQGEGGSRGYLPASGLLHVVADFLATATHGTPVALGEASVGIQLAAATGEVVQ